MPKTSIAQSNHAITVSITIIVVEVALVLDVVLSRKHENMTGGQVTWLFLVRETSHKSNMRRWFWCQLLYFAIWRKKCLNVFENLKIENLKT